MDEWMSTHRVTTLFCTLCQRTRVRVTDKTEPAPTPQSMRCCKWQNRPFTIDDLDYWTNTNIEERCEATCANVPTACGLMTSFLMRSGIFVDLLTSKAAIDVIQALSRGAIPDEPESGFVILAKAAYEPKNNNTPCPIVADHGLERFLCPLNSMMLDYSDITSARYPGERIKLMCGEHTLGDEEEEAEKTIKEHKCSLHSKATLSEVCQELCKMRQWAIYLSVMLQVNENLHSSNRYITVHRAEKDGLLYIQPGSFSPSQKKPGLKVHRTSCGWINCWGPFAYAALEELDDYPSNDHINFSKAMQFQREQIEQCTVLWKAMSFDTRMRFMRQCTSFFIGGMNHMCSFMLHPVFSYLLQPRNLSYSPEQLSHNEFIELQPDVMLRYICRSDDMEFFRDPAIIRLHLIKVREFYSAMLAVVDSCTHDGRRFSFLSNLVLSWTHYRGMLAMMVYHSLHCVVQDMKKSTERALADLHLSPSPKSSPPKRKKKNKKSSTPTSPLPPPPPPPMPSPPMKSPQEPPEWLDGMLDSLKWCLYCKQVPYDCVAMPCKHVSCCQVCLEREKRCAFCNVAVEGVLPVCIV